VIEVNIKMRTTVVSLLLAVGVIAGCSKSAETPAGAPGSPPAAAPASSPEPPAGQPSGQGVAAAPKRAEPSAAHASPPPPTFKEITLARGTQLGLTLDTAVASDRSTIEEPVRASLRRDIVRDGLTVLPAGTALSGSITAAERSGKVKGLAHIAFRFTSLAAGDERYDIQTSAVSRTARTTKRKDATKIGIGAGAGALIGGIIGGGQGAAIGAGVGAAGGTGVVMNTRGEEVRLAAGTPLSVTLTEPLTIRVLLPR
jgi:hypothetical protein